MDEGIVKVRINKVIDGDTVDVMMGNIHHRIRLYGVDAPEHDQPYGDDAQSFLECITPYDAPAELELIGAEKWGRLCGIIRTSDGTVLNEELLKYGYAWYYSQYGDLHPEYESLQNRAKSRGLGLWADPNPTPPWDFRREPPREEFTINPATVSVKSSKPAQQAPTSSKAYLGLGTSIGGVGIGLGIPVGGGPKKESYLLKQTSKGLSAAASFPVTVLEAILEIGDDGRSWCDVRWKVYTLLILFFPLGIWGAMCSNVMTKKEKIGCWLFLLVCYCIGRVVGH